MKLIMEGASLLTGFYEDELNEASGSTERNYYISGIFSTPEAKNRNGRVYSRSIWEREVQKYQKEINERSANTLGEWQHPPRSTVDPLKAVLRIVELKMDDAGNVVGKAKILNDNTEQTNKLKGLIKEGIKIGVSSRGVGKVSSTGVVEDFKLITYDAVDMPSDYNAMLDGMVEGVQFLNGIAQDREYRIDENGCIGEVCGLTAPVTENSGEENVDKEKCPIQEKIDEAVAAAKEDIFTQIGEYLKESFAEIKSDREVLIESISDFLEGPKEEVFEEVVESTVDFTDEKAKALVASLRSLAESKDEDEEEDDADEDEKDSTKGKCAECGKKVEDGEKKCGACAAKDEDDDKDDDDKETNEAIDIDKELADQVKMGKISEKELAKVIEFAKVCNPKTCKEDLITAFGKKFERTVLDRVANKVALGK